MTTEEAKKAGFRTASGALYVYWCIENGHIYVRSCDACALTGNDFPTRAKAREALRKRKEEEEVNRKSRFIDNFVQPMQEYLSSKSKPDAEHAKWLADMQAQATPITPEQAKGLRDGDVIYRPRIGGISEDSDTMLLDAGCTCYWTREAAQAALDKAKCSTLPEGVAPVPEGYEFVDPNKIEIVMVDSKTYIFDVEEKRWHLLNGFNSGLMVSTKWNLEHGIYFARPKTEAEPQPKVGDFCDELDIIRARCRNTPWLANHGKAVESHETPVGETQGKEVVTDETQSKEPSMGFETTDIGELGYTQDDIDKSEVELRKIISHPSHYTSHPSGVECITITKHMNFCRGNAMKYLWRAGQKGDSLDKEIEDIAKAEEYCRVEKERLIAKKGEK